MDLELFLLILALPQFSDTKYVSVINVFIKEQFLGH